MPLKDDETQQILHDVTDRVEQVRKYHNLSRLAFCQRIAFSYPRYHHITGERASRPTVDLLSAVVSRMAINPAWLLQGTGPMLQAEADRGADPSAYAMIPLLRVEASAGGGSFVENEDEIETFLAFQRGWIRRELNASIKNLCLIRVQGESMVPLLNPGDVVLLNRAAAQLHVDGVYALRLSGALLIKRLQFLPRAQVAVISDNAAYQNYHIHLEDPGSEDFSIIGQVVWAGKQL